MNETPLQALKPLFSRSPSSHKYNFGHVLVIGGAPGTVGAPLLAARAALRVGAGLATIASVPAVIGKLEKRVEEVMTWRLPESTPNALPALRDFIDEHKVKVLAIGPGLNRAAAPVVKDLLDTVRLPMVLDAGGLSAFDGQLDVIRAAAKQNPDIILTPHQGEFARLIGRPLPAAEKAIQKQVADTAAANGVTIVLKGYHSLVVNAAGQLYTNQSGNPGLATAGTGDVLTGIIAGLVAQGLATFEAATCGVYLHGLAGDLAAAAKTQAGMIASDVTEHIPAALLQIKRES